MTMILRLAAFGLAALAVAPADAAGPTTRPAFSGHRAVYEMRLAEARSTPEIGAASGRLVYEFSGSRCEGWATRLRNVTRIDPIEGPSRLTDMRSTSFEDGAGRSFDFVNETWIDGRKVEESKGRAERAAAAIHVRLERPAAAEADVAARAFFPTYHMEEIVAAALDGERLKEIDLYDGSETGTKTYRTSVVIGNEATGPDDVSDEPAAVSDLLTGHRRWPVQISFFDLTKKGEGEATPDYQLSFLLYDNGVSRRMIFDYGSFVLRGELTRLEPLSSAPCR